DAHHRRVLDRREQQRLAAEALGHVGALAEVALEDFERDLPTQRNLDSEVHLGHPATADVAEHLEAPSPDEWLGSHGAKGLARAASRFNPPGTYRHRLECNPRE